MSASIEVLLRQDIKALGNRGEIVKVNKGYARNYLFPQGLALVPTKDSLLELEREKKRIIRAAENLAGSFKELVPKIESASCTIEVKANKEGVLFGAVSPQMIVDALAKEDITGIKNEMIVLEMPIKELGVYHIKINLYNEISAVCRLWIVEESEPNAKALDENHTEEKPL